jgi:phosphatidylglycerophosphatase A
VESATPISDRDKLVIWLAEGFGVGKLPFAPGTFASLVGLGWIWVLLLPQNVWLYLAGIVGGFFFAVWVGGKAERILDRKDPANIVIDEIVAIPLGYLPFIFMTGSGLGIFDPWSKWIAVFLLFRFFDIAKPYPVGISQRLRGGWGLVVDDMLAALYTAAAITFGAWLLQRL